MTVLLVAFQISTLRVAAEPLQLDTTINLKDALVLGVERYPSIKARLAERQGAYSKVSVARAGYIPKLLLQEQVTFGSANSMAGTFWPNEGYAIPTSGAVRSQQIWTGAFGQYTTMAVNGPITSFGKLGKAVDAARLQASEAEYAYQNEIFQHKIRIADHYLRLLVFQQFVSVQESNLSRARELQKAIDARVASGLRPGVDSASVHAEVSKARMNLLDAQRQEQSANLALAELIGVDGKTLKTDPMDFTSQLPPTLGEDEQLDALQNPFLKYSRARWLSATGESNAARIAWRPTLSYMVAGTGRGSGIANSTDVYSRSFLQGVSYTRYNYLLGVHLLWNLLDFTKQKHVYHALASAAEARQHEFETTQLEVDRSLKDARLQLHVAIEQAHEAPVQLRAAKSAFDQASARYRTGLGTLPELSENLLLLSRAEADYAIAYSNVWRSVLGVASASGNLDLFLNQVTTK